MMRYIASLLSVIFALLLGMIFLYATGYDAVAVYNSIFTSALGDSFGLSETLVRATPLVLCALAVAIGLRASLWNIGAEGQFLVGAIACGGIALSFPQLPALLLLPMMFVAGALGGAMWAGIAGLLKSRFSVNEILTTLLMNYIAADLMNYLVYGPWKDSQGSNFPNTPLFSHNAWLPLVGWGRLHYGCWISLALVALVYVYLQYSKAGFEIHVLGDSRQAAQYAGISVARRIFYTMLLSGALAGIAGMVEVAGLEHKLHHNMPRGYGYTAIIIAWIAGKDPRKIIPVAILLAAMTVGGEIAQIEQRIPLATVNVLQGILLLSILANGFVQGKLEKWWQQRQNRSKTVDSTEQRMYCMEISGGNRAIDRCVKTAGLEGVIYSKPHGDSPAGGDVYYLSSCATGRITRMLVADVSGHGAAVADISHQLRLLMRRYVNFIDQSRFVAEMNDQFTALSRRGSFATAVALSFFAPTNELELSNAGHPPPLLYSQRQRCWQFIEHDTSGEQLASIPLGILQATQYQQHKLCLDAGDVVLCYTDSLIETRQSDGKQIGREGLREILQAIDERDLPQLPHRLLEAIIAKAEDEFADDVTILAIRPTGRGYRVPFYTRLLAPWRILAGIITSIRNGEPLPKTEWSLRNLGGVAFHWFNKR